MYSVQFLDRDWWLSTRRYRTPEEAKAAWEKAVTGWTLHAGVSRHGNNVDGAVYVTVVSEEKRETEKGEKLLEGGEVDVLDWEFSAAIIARRIRVMADAPLGKTEVVRRPESRGARLYPDGTMKEHPPGRG